ncbi:MAG: DNA-binding protein [Patescibacteria group bacterium]|nr:DNA-binding protein [Patescibacteria group bacterium]
MKSIKKDDIIIARFDDKEEIFSGLEKVVKKYNLQSAIILSGIGMMQKVKLGYFTGKGKYKGTKFAGYFEIVNFAGSLLQTKQKDFKPHIHVVLAKKNKKTVGGHLVEGTVFNTLELFLLDLKTDRIYRQINKKTDLFGLEIDE